jgi:SH3-like domain-containing protein
MKSLREKGRPFPRFITLKEEENNRKWGKMSEETLRKEDKKYRVER